MVNGAFSVSVFLNTGGQNINAVEVDLRFPADRLQVVSPLSGQSVVSLWAAPPSFSNTEGRINLKGGIPSPGIRTNAGNIATISFRVTGVGQAAIRFTGESKVLLDDGQGTDVLADTRGAVYTLELPPPEGPAVSTSTHPDPQAWYQDKNPTFVWEKKPEVTAFSYILNDRPVDVPDDIPDGDATRVQYNGLADGIWYFHIKARGKDSWGGVSHLQIKIDATPPSAFPLEITPRARTSSRQPSIAFVTTDNLSGVTQYEMKIVQVNAPESGARLTPFFLSVESPYRPPAPLELGAYDVIVRSYDGANNIREVRRKLSIVPIVYQVIGDRGISVSGLFVITWPVVWAFGVLSVLLLLLLLYYFYLRHKRHDARLRAGLNHPDHPLREDVTLLRKKQQEYGHPPYNHH